MMREGAVYDDGMLRIAWVGSPPVLAIAGEIDESTYPGLVGVLKEVADEHGADEHGADEHRADQHGADQHGADQHREVHVSLAEVDYCDLAGLRAIVMLTGADGLGHDGEGHSQNGDGRHRRRVVLHEMPSQLQTVLRIVGWDSIPGLALLDGHHASSQAWSDAIVEAGQPTGGRG
jgi:hypothetical protein